MKKPPNGLMPRWLFKLHQKQHPDSYTNKERRASIRSAVWRYVRSGKLPPWEWFGEYFEIMFK